MTEEEKKEYEEFLAWKRAKAAAPSAPETPPTPDAPRQPAPQKGLAPVMSLMLVLVGLAVVLFVVTMMVRGCNGGPARDYKATPAALYDSAASDSTAQPAAGQDAERPAVETTAWDYKEEVDAMTDKTSYFATVRSTDQATFDFPYNGGSYLYLTVRQSPRYGTDVIVQISSGQFIGGIDGQNIKVRFDDERAYDVFCNEPADYSSDCLFLTGAKGFISKLKTHKRLLISAEFYQEGAHTFTFDISGLEWEH